MSVVAVVVTYNRLNLLRECLDGLLRQTYPLDEILVIDNGSTDGTIDAVRNEYPSVVLFTSERNLGGAGGFSVGLDLALRRGHTAAWLMDDDALPADDTLAPLVAVLQSEANPGFAASEVRTTSGEALADHAATTDEVVRGVRTLGGFDVLPSDYATFVGVLVNLEVARATHLPISDFFIWYDDNEYTRRLGRLSRGYYVPASVIQHPKKVRTRDIGGRVYYAVRNLLWICRMNWSRGLRRHYLHDAATTAAAQVLFGANKKQSIRDVARAVRDGVVHRPTLPPIGSQYQRVQDSTALAR